MGSPQVLAFSARLIMTCQIGPGMRVVRCGGCLPSRRSVRSNEASFPRPLTGRSTQSLQLSPCFQ